MTILVFYTLLTGCFADSEAGVVDPAEVGVPSERCVAGLENATDAFKRAQEEGDPYALLTAKGQAEEAIDVCAGTLLEAAARDIVDACNVEIEAKGYDAVLESEADRLISEGRKGSLLGQGTSFEDEEKQLNYFISAIESYTAARRIYRRLLNYSLETGKTEQMQRYEHLIASCDADINEIWRWMSPVREQSETFYGRALNLYANGSCREAYETVNLSRKLFNGMGSPSGVYKCETLMAQLHECLVDYENAEGFIEVAEGFYGTADYWNATLTIDRAEEIYSKYHNSEGLNLTADFKRQIAWGVWMKKEADQGMTEAYGSYDKHDFLGSMEKARAARDIYQQINYSRGMEEAGKLIASSERQTHEDYSSDSYWKFLIGRILTIFLLTLPLWTYPWIYLVSGRRRTFEKKMIRIPATVVFSLMASIVLFILILSGYSWWASVGIGHAEWVLYLVLWSIQYAILVVLTLVPAFLWEKVRKMRR